MYVRVLTGFILECAQNTQHFNLSQAKSQFGSLRYLGSVLFVPTAAADLIMDFAELRTGQTSRAPFTLSSAHPFCSQEPSTDFTDQGSSIVRSNQNHV